jgi:alpha-tubulin suppressor-like RCC1 family protein
MHALAAKADGALWAWGWNDYGQLGVGFDPSGYTSDKYRPTVCTGDGGWAAVAAGAMHTAAIKGDGTLWACGRGHYGQLGDGTSAPRADFVKVGNAADWARMDAGDYHTVAIKANGRLWACGRNSFGQLGSGGGANDSLFAIARVGGESDWSSVAAGYQHTAAIKTDGGLWQWGADWSPWDGTNDVSKIPAQRTPAPVGAEKTWTAASGGSYHTLAMKSDGTLWAWGYNGRGQLGDGGRENRSAPVLVGGGFMVPAK